MNTRRYLYWGGAALSLAAALAWAFAPRPLEVEVATVTSGTFESAIEDDGKTRLVDQYVVAAPLAGQLARIGLREGDAVAAGAVVAQLRPTQPPLLDARTVRQQQARLDAALAQVRAAEAGVARAAVLQERARHDYQRSARLGDAGFVAASRVEGEQLALAAAERELDAARAQRQIARHEAEQARAALAASSSLGQASAMFPVRAPVAGRVLRVLAPSEVAVAPGAPLLELGDPGRLEVVAELLTTDAVLARPGAAVRIARWGGPPLGGRVRRIEPAAFTKISALGVEEQRVRVVITLDDPDGAATAMGVGYRVTVRIMTERREQVVKVPVAALFPLPGRADADGAMAVYRVRDGRASLTPVRLGGRNDMEAWVLDGLAPGQQVIVYPASGVHDGARVKVRSVARRH
ncbi:efflux RND transporter periplasmic adaptor subunit [Massilia sp. PAMC28688]|uniref:efflux RND transporter periplasmic adaptor subunit n=1 Tax=Massilia sp. PAMC28688 TaxID=2861283 RepID=UPI001C631FDD|nr:efflux RND transporter periplasmic adaptor subunit [Massilia sp. PAMC28688]QYF92991.1 efflux RND transporter periplasmic adaptor subunit [Massilia sp. PAMC28688]